MNKIAQDNLKMILHYTEPKDLGNCIRVCKQWNRILTSDDFLKKYFSEIPAIHALLDGKKRVVKILNRQVGTTTKNSLRFFVNISFLDATFYNAHYVLKNIKNPERRIELTTLGQSRGGSLQKVFYSLDSSQEEGEGLMEITNTIFGVPCKIEIMGTPSDTKLAQEINPLFIGRLRKTNAEMKISFKRYSFLLLLFLFHIALRSNQDRQLFLQ